MSKATRVGVRGFIPLRDLMAVLQGSTATTAREFAGWDRQTRTLALARLIAALVCNISDCDETYNYWEPTHYLLHGSGFQTWEYSPVYALRSYFYLLPHAAPSIAAAWAGVSSKVTAWYLTRGALGLVSAWAESRLVVAVGRSRLFLFRCFCRARA